MLQPAILWFRNDLRFHDNAAIQQASLNDRPVIPVYIIERQWMAETLLHFPRMGQNRLDYLKATLKAFKTQIEEKGGKLLIFEGNTVEILVRLYQYFNASTVIAHHEYAYEEILMEQELAQRVNLQLFWGNQLFAPGTFPLNVSASPFYYTAFRNKVNSLKDQFCEVPTVSSVNWMFVDQENIPFPLYWVEDGPSEVAGIKAGEICALQHMYQYFQSPFLKDYETRRELFEGNGASTTLSPFLATGALSVNRVVGAIQAVKIMDDQTAASVAKLKDQLIWRDYYRWLFLRYGKKIFYRKGLRNVVPTMYDDYEAFQSWINGETSHPLINALMNELKATGWMSNRGRMIAAYYLSKELKVHWLWGAQWFESQLIDYDVCNNYGNWAYQSGTGTDSRINRRFNLDKQMQKFDPKGEYVSKWQ